MFGRMLAKKLAWGKWFIVIKERRTRRFEVSNDHLPYQSDGYVKTNDLDELRRSKLGEKVEFEK